MRRCRSPLLVVLAAVCAAQVAEEANKSYRDEQSRRRMARMLDGAHRDGWQKPRELVAAMKLKPGMTVVDLGAGAGYMLPYLSEAVGPAGTVVAQEIYQDFLDKARRKCAARRLNNVVFVLGSETDVNLAPGSANVVLLLDTYHHFNYPARMLAGIREALKDGGRLIVVDYYKRNYHDPRHIRLEDTGVIREIEANGFRLVRRHDHVPGSQYFLVLKKR